MMKMYLLMCEEVLDEDVVLETVLDDGDGAVGELDSSRRCQCTLWCTRADINLIPMCWCAKTRRRTA
jgi:hypothetical protein